MTNPHTCSEDVQKAVSIALHQIRTRALRDAPIYLQHISIAEKELQQSLVQLITKYGDQRELAGRIDELEAMAQSSDTAPSPVFNPLSSVGRVELKDRIAELMKEGIL